MLLQLGGGFVVALRASRLRSELRPAGDARATLGTTTDQAREREARAAIEPVTLPPMDWAYQYRDPETLYLNVTNRCTNRCSFCVRSSTSRLGDGHLLGGSEPSFDELMEAIEERGGPESYRELIWCGYGEPTFRLDLIRLMGPIFRAAGANVRLNTNGHACLIHGRDVLPELGEVIDRVNISLNAPNARRYEELCRPDPGAAARWGSTSPSAFWEAVLDFLARAPEHIDDVRASVVGHTLSDDEIARCRKLAHALAGAPLRVR